MFQLKFHRARGAYIQHAMAEYNDGNPFLHLMTSRDAILNPPVHISRPLETVLEEEVLVDVVTNPGADDIINSASSADRCLVYPPTHEEEAARLLLEFRAVSAANEQRALGNWANERPAQVVYANEHWDQQEEQGRSFGLSEL